MCCFPAAVTSFLSFLTPRGKTNKQTNSISTHKLKNFFPFDHIFSSSLSYSFHAAGFVPPFLHRAPAGDLRRCSAAMLLPWFEFQDISDWLPILTADDLMETLLSSALKNWRMIYNEMQPLSLCRGGMWGTSGEFLYSLNFWHLCFWVTKSSHYIPSCPPIECLSCWLEVGVGGEGRLQTCGGLMHV